LGRVAKSGKFANWVVPPARGINNQPIEFICVRFN
jgi:benzoyl-CoA 2,3-dioxygenase component B